MTETVRVAVRRFPPFADAIVRQFEDFARTSGVAARIEIEALDLNPLHECLFAQRELADGSWDIAFLSTDWIAEAQAAGLIEDLQPFQARAPIPDWPDAWSPSLTTIQRFAGGWWGLPYHDGPECLIYRKDLLAEAGLAVPTTWDGFHAAARRLHDPERGIVGTVLALFPDGHNSFYGLCIHLWTRGGEPFDRDGRPTFATPQGEAALDFLRTLAADRDAVGSDLREIDSVKSGIRFAEGKVAMMANWFGFAAFAETWGDGKLAGKIDVSPLPAGAGGRSVSLNVFWMLTMAEGSRRKELVWSFIRHCATPAMDRLTTQAGAIGVRRSTWADPEINAAIPYYGKLDLLHREARQMPLHPKLSAISEVVDRMIDRAVTTDAPSRQLLQAAQREIAVLVG